MTATPADAPAAAEVAVSEVAADALVAAEVAVSEVAADALVAAEVAVSEVAADALVADEVAVSEVAADALVAAEVAADALVAAEVAVSESPGVTTAEAAQLLGEAIGQVQRVIVGQEHMVEQLMVALLAKGHCLLEGVPGTAKTLAVRTFATVVGGDFARIQFTPDLVPSDIVGTRIYSAAKETFDIQLGPVFVNFLLADEINRAPAKVQSAMLEIMAEQQASIGGRTYPAKRPFIVIATQNPIESEGVYPLPEAQRDRFLLKVDIDYPRGNEEFEILRRMSVKAPEAVPVLDPARVLELQEQASRVFVHNLVAEYVVRLVLATRQPGDFGMPDLVPVISIGCSSRATLGLVAAARAVALIHGRDYVLPTDVQAVATDVMAHRLVLSFDAVADNIDSSQVVERILAMVPPPTPVWHDRAGAGAARG